MKSLLTCLSALCLLLLASCAGGGKPSGNEHLAAEGLSDRLNRNYGYEVDGKGNWVPRTDKRSQYEGRGESAYFNGSMNKKSFQTETMRKGSWMGNKEAYLPNHRHGTSQSSMGGDSRFSSQQAALDRSLQTPARIEGNHLSTANARESGTGDIRRPSDAETDARRRVFTEPDIIDYRQQRELSIRESKRLLGRD